MISREKANKLVYLGLATCYVAIAGSPKTRTPTIYLPINTPEERLQAFALFPPNGPVSLQVLIQYGEQYLRTDWEFPAMGYFTDPILEIGSCAHMPYLADVSRCDCGTPVFNDINGAVWPFKDYPPPPSQPAVMCDTCVFGHSPKPKEKSA